MNKEKTDRNEQAPFGCFGSGREPETAGKCPMAEMCQQLIKNPRVGRLAMIPAFIMICLGVLILLEPKVLLWLIGVICIVLGCAILAGAHFLRKFQAHQQSGPGAR